jgi:acyl carrier protein
VKEWWPRAGRCIGEREEREERLFHPSEENAMRPDEIVRTVIALHMQVSPATITYRSHLQRDLELDPLDLVLIALRIEDIKAVEFPIARLEGAQTVADLTKIVRSLGVETSDENESAFTLDELGQSLVIGA